MAKQTINLGTGELTGDGESIRSAFDKINKNFDETYLNISALETSAFSGSYNDLTDTPILFSGSYNELTDKPTLFDGNYNSLSNTPDLSQYVSRAEFNTGTVTIDVNNTGDLVGSVFADDSTILVDGVAGKIRGNIESDTVNITATVADVNITAVDDIDLETTGANADIRLASSDNIRMFAQSDISIDSVSYVGIFTDVGNSNHNFIFSETGYFEVLADNGGINVNNELNFLSSGTPDATLSLNSGVLEVVTNSGFRLKTNTGTTQLEYDETGSGVLRVRGTIEGILDGDVTGSVFADDSTLLVDGVNGVVPYSVLDGAPTALSDFSNDLDYAAIVATQIQTNGLPIGTEASGLFARAGQSLALGYKNSEGSAFSHIAFSEANSIQIQANVNVAAATTFDFNGATITGTSFLTSIPTTLGINKLTTKEVYEEFNTITNATGVVVHDLSTGHIFNHGLMNANFTPNLTNIDTTALTATSVVLFITQQGTAYMPTALQIDGVAQTINWQGGSQPVGTPNGVDVVTFSIMIFGPGSYTVLGQSVSFS